MGAYGLIGFFSTLMTSMVFFDFGLGVACAKIIAESNEDFTASLVRKIRTIELLYLVIATVLGISIILGSKIISDYWLVINDVNVDGSWLVKLMGLLFIFSWPKSLYAGFFTGMKNIVLFNKIQIIILLLQSLILYIGLTSKYSNINLYFYILILVSLIETVLLRVFSMRYFNKTFKLATFQELKQVLKFSSGIGALSVLSLIAFQFDKIVISKFFSIETLGEYNLASVIPFSLLTLIYPITAAAFPRMVNIDTDISSVKVFKGWSILLLLVSVNFCLLIGLNFQSIYLIWITKFDESLIELSILLLAGIFLYSTTILLYNLFLANGKSWVITIIYTIAIIIYVVSFFTIQNPTITTMAYSWVYFNIVLFLGHGIALFKFNHLLFKYYYSVLVFFLVMFIGLSFVLNHILDIYNLWEYSFVIDIIVFGIFFVSILIFVLKRGILKYD
jgi:O-antigen/teichoic acid export membrane protein